MNKDKNNAVQDSKKATAENAPVTTDAPVTETPAENASETPKATAPTVEAKPTDKKADAPKPKAETLEDKLSAKAKEVARYYPKESAFVVTEDGSVFLDAEKNAAEFHAKQKKQKLFVYHVATATLKEA